MNLSEDIEILCVGSSGAKVEQLQQKLREQGLYLGTIDGLFGQGLQTAVREFQYRAGLTSDGIVGLSTLEALGFITIDRDSE